MFAVELPFFQSRICAHRRRPREAFDRPLAGIIADRWADPLHGRGAAGCIFCNKVAELAGFPQMGKFQKIRPQAIQAFILVVSVVCGSAGKSPTEMFSLGEHYANGSLAGEGLEIDRRPRQN